MTAHRMLERRRLVERNVADRAKSQIVNAFGFGIDSVSGTDGLAASKGF